MADPKALNHILQKSGYLYAKPGSTQEELVFGHGLVWAGGEFPITIVPPSLRLTIPQATCINVTGG